MKGLKNLPSESLYCEDKQFKSLLTPIFVFMYLQVTQLDPNKSLLEVKLYPQETLFLEAKE